jgi:hypothetical protein
MTGDPVETGSLAGDTSASSGAGPTATRPARTGRTGAATAWGAMASRAAVVIASALAVLLAMSGCNVAPARDGQGTDGGAMPSTAARTDREPIAKRFPKLGDFVAVHWQGGGYGTGDGRVPGPTDVWIRALVRLHPDDLAAAKAMYSFEPAPSGWDVKMPGDLREYLPAGGDWRHDPQYEADVRSAKYHGKVYLEVASGTAYLDLNSI